MSVTPAAFSAFTADIVSPVIFGHIVNDLSAFLVFDKRSGRNHYNKVFCGSSVYFSTLAVLTVSCYEFVLISESKKGIASLINAENYISAMASVSITVMVRNTASAALPAESVTK